MSEGISTVSDLSFKTEVLEANKPVLVDFWAPWCGPCRALAPHFEKVAARYGDKVIFVKMNVDDNPQTPSNYGVQSIPTLILFKAGQVAATSKGSMGESELAAFLERNL